MENFNYQKKLKRIWEVALAKYEAGDRDPNNYFSLATLADLSAIGLNTMDVYDYVEDYVSYGEPDFETFLLVSSARKDYLFLAQEGNRITKLIDGAALPGKDAKVNGIVWLPRIMHKAWAKLRGALPPETMYGCSGDRSFFKEYNIHPADFLRIAWAYEKDESKLVDWVIAQKSQ